VYWTITVILFVLWVVGLITGSTEGHWVHLFLLFSMASLLLALMSRAQRNSSRSRSGRSIA
jgi:hypothetical protein